MDKEQKKQPSPFELETAHVLERYAWYAGRSIDMMPYSEVYKIVNTIIDEVTAAHMQTVATICADYTMSMLQDLAHANGLIDALEEASNIIDLLTEHLKAANNTIEFEKRTRLELPRDANGNRIYPDSMLKGWGAIEDFWYTNGYWQVRGHDTSAPWIPAEEAVVCQEDSGRTTSDDKPGDDSDQATPEAKRLRGCKTRDEAEDIARALCLGILPITALLDLLCPSDDDASEEA